jgi:urease accessory protein
MTVVAKTMEIEKASASAIHPTAFRPSPLQQGVSWVGGAAPATPLARFDARGEIGFAGTDAALKTLRQQSPIRFLRPRPDDGDPMTAVLVNTAGGIVGGDRLGIQISARDDANVLVTGQAAEKIYRSTGETADLAVTIECRTGAALEFLPQGTIFHDGARLRRRTRLRVDADSRLIFGEILYFGRSAMGETFSHGSIDDLTELEWAGHRVWIDALRLGGSSLKAMENRGGLDGAVCAAMILVVTPSPARSLIGLRSVLPQGVGEDFHAGAGVFQNGPLVVRWLGTNAMALRHSYSQAWCHLRAEVIGRPARMPKIWSI